MEIDQVTLDTSARSRMASICWPISSGITTAKTEKVRKKITKEIKRNINLPITQPVLSDSQRKSNLNSQVRDGRITRRRCFVLTKNDQTAIKRFWSRTFHQALKW